MRGTTITPPTGQKKSTFGEKAVGLKFNPAGDNEVDRIKKLYAEIIDICNETKTSMGFDFRLRDKAVMSAVTAQMAAVKLITWKY